MPVLFILVGAEGVAEMKDGDDFLVDGIREATSEEQQAFVQGLESLIKEQPGITARDYFVDGTGRPYWLMAVDAEKSPAQAVAKAKKYKRVVRLLD